MFSGSMKTSPQGEDIWVSFSSAPMGPASALHGVLSTKDLPSTSGVGSNQGQSQWDVCFGSFLHNPGQQLKRRPLISGTGILLGGLRPLEAAFGPDKKSLLKLCMYIYTRKCTHYKLFSFR